VRQEITSTGRSEEVLGKRSEFPTLGESSQGTEQRGGFEAMDMSLSWPMRKRDVGADRVTMDVLQVSASDQGRSTGQGGAPLSGNLLPQGDEEEDGIECFFG
jgi:hypothetical protein